MLSLEIKGTWLQFSLLFDPHLSQYFSLTVVALFSSQPSGDQAVFNTVQSKRQLQRSKCKRNDREQGQPGLSCQTCSQGGPYIQPSSTPPPPPTLPPTLALCPAACHPPTAGFFSCWPPRPPPASTGFFRPGAPKTISCRRPQKSVGQLW